jgi:hypothetical protein
MRLAAVMGLMIEKMKQNILQCLLVRLARSRLVRNGFDEIGVPIASNDIYQTTILRDPGAKEILPIFVQDHVEAIRVIPCPGQAFQPYAIREQQMIQRAMKAAEENAGRTTIDILRHVEGSAIKAKIGPAIIIGKLAEISIVIVESFRDEAE